MKRTIFIMVILTFLVTSPPLFLEWFESQRIKQISGNQTTSETDYR